MNEVCKVRFAVLAKVKFILVRLTSIQQLFCLIASIVSITEVNLFQCGRDPFVILTEWEYVEEGRGIVHCCVVENERLVFDAVVMCGGAFVHEFDECSG